MQALYVRNFKGRCILREKGKNEAVALRAYPRYDFSFIYSGIESRANWDFFCPKRELYALCFVCEGEGEFSYEQESYKLTAGDVFLFFKHETARAKPNKINPYKYLYIGFMGSDCEEIFAHAGITKTTRVLNLEYDEKLKNAFYSIHKLFKQDNLLNSIKIQREFLKIIYILCKKNDENKKVFSTRKEKIVEKVKDYIHENYFEPITISQIAATLNYERTYLSKIFKEITEVSVIDYLINYRIQKSVILLRSTDKSMAEIAFDCGFSDSNSYYVRFKSKVGCSPFQYRKMLRDSSSLF